MWIQLILSTTFMSLCYYNRCYLYNLKNAKHIIEQLITNKVAKYFVHVDKNYYIVHYPFGVNWYKIIIPRHRKPCKITSITDSSGLDISKDIFEYMGPSHNFHGITVSPQILGYETIIFEYINGDKKEFSNKDEIKI